MTNSLGTVKIIGNILADFHASLAIKNPPGFYLSFNLSFGLTHQFLNFNLMLFFHYAFEASPYNIELLFS